jgi:hypothetical protein
MAGFDDQEKRAASPVLIRPPNKLKQKVGSGGFDRDDLLKAQVMIENNTIDFQPTATMFLNLLKQAIIDIKSEKIVGAAAISAILYPIIQLNAHGTMFHYPIISKICSFLVTFFEEVKSIDGDTMSIVLAFENAMIVILSKSIKDENNPVGKALCEALQGACERYRKKKMGAG